MDLGRFLMWGLISVGLGGAVVAAVLAPISPEPLAPHDVTACPTPRGP